MYFYWNVQKIILNQLIIGSIISKYSIKSIITFTIYRKTSILPSSFFPPFHECSIGSVEYPFEITRSWKRSRSQEQRESPLRIPLGSADPTKAWHRSVLNQRADRLENNIGVSQSRFSALSWNGFPCTLGNQANNLVLCTLRQCFSTFLFSSSRGSIETC